MWRVLQKRLITKIEIYPAKEKVERGGYSEKTLRSPIALALVKLFRRLPEEIFEAKLPRLLVVVCNGLRNRDSNERDVARETLAKIAASIDIKYFPDIVRELAQLLSEGYQLHVRSAALHSVVLALSEINAGSGYLSAVDPESRIFSLCIPAEMDLIQQNRFVSANDIKEVEGVKKHLTKEASGGKSFNTLEIVARNILFKPYLALPATDEFKKIRDE